MLVFFFFYVPATTGIYTYVHNLSLHDALPICSGGYGFHGPSASLHDVSPVRLVAQEGQLQGCGIANALEEHNGKRRRHTNARRGSREPAQRYFSRQVDRKSTRLNSSH